MPALTALMAEANWLKETTGVRADATVKLYVDGSCVAEDTGEVQMADYGISGIPAFQVSRYAKRCIRPEAVCDGNTSTSYRNIQKNNCAIS